MRLGDFLENLYRTAAGDVGGKSSVVMGMR
jgi:hypothetical protein